MLKENWQNVFTWRQTWLFLLFWGFFVLKKANYIILFRVSFILVPITLNTSKIITTQIFWNSLHFRSFILLLVCEIDFQYLLLTYHLWCFSRILNFTTMMLKKFLANYLVIYDKNGLFLQSGQFSEHKVRAFLQYSRIFTCF